MPGAVPRTATQALSGAIAPYVAQLAGADWEKNPALATGINVRAGEIVHPAVAAALHGV
jgi:alanine dehydrogenase